NFATRLSHKDFPNRFLDKIKDLNLVNHPVPNYIYGSITPKQSEILSRFGFEPHHLSNVSKAEAATLLSGLLSDNPDFSKWILPSGLHAGKHVSLVPPLYIKQVLSTPHMKRGSVGKILQEFQRKKNAG